MLLKVNEIHKFFGKSHILQGVSLEIERGEIAALLGRNAVGKSTTLKSLGSSIVDLPGIAKGPRARSGSDRCALITCPHVIQCSS